MSFPKKIRFYFAVLFDRNTPWYVRLLIGIGMVYLVVPIDLVPDHLPFLGFIDDITVGSALIALALKLVPKNVFDRHRRKFE